MEESQKTEIENYIEELKSEELKSSDNNDNLALSTFSETPKKKNIIKIKNNFVKVSKKKMCQTISILNNDLEQKINEYTSVQYRDQYTEKVNPDMCDYLYFLENDYLKVLIADSDESIA